MIKIRNLRDVKESVKNMNIRHWTLEKNLFHSFFNCLSNNGT